MKYNNIYNQIINRFLYYLSPLFFILTSFSSHILWAQTSSIQVYEGTTIKLGDTITAGYKPSAHKYNTIKVRQGKNLVDYKEDIAFSKLEVISIESTDKAFTPSLKEARLTVKDISNGQELLIDINSAIEKGEVIARPAQRLYKDAKFLSDDLLLALTLRVNKLPITDKEILLLISLKDKDLYRKCKANEFEYNKVKPEYAKQLETMMDEFDFASVYYINDQLSIGKYDLTRKGYPLSFSMIEGKNYLKYGGYYIAISDYNRFLFVPVDERYGDETNKRRQGQKTYISNLAYGRFYFKMLDKRMEIKKDNMINTESLYRQTLVGAEMLGIELCDFKHCDYNYIGSKSNN